ncbi:MarC family protein [bacterium]|nr:MarC family protein [Candidatus Omnitrophota bacterium]MBU2527857.1 MarC family protein [bacterium]MBU3929210.1 MarC family protein [bacterium]MBU4122255.1 MarC family protein [bacterium]
MHKFLLCFIPLFVAVDTPGILPMFISLTEGFKKRQLRRIIVQSILTAVAVSVLFVFFGKTVLGLLNITVYDFMIAGGMLLFIISVSDILSYEKKQRHIDADSLGAVPIGVPLIVGPAVLTTSLILVNEYGIYLTVAALVINILIAGLIFFLSGNIYKLLGSAGSKTLSKIANLLLAAIAVMIIRKGIAGMLQ